MRRKNFLLAALSLLLAIGAVEALLRVLEHTRFGEGKFNLLPAATYEHFYFFNSSKADRRAYLGGPYDPLLGWRNPGRPVINSPTNRDTYNSEGWRARHEYTNQKTTKRRVILIGDSFTYGFMVDDSETMDVDLERELGPDTEVDAMAVPAYGTDQLALVATRIAPNYNPDVIVVNFIADDLNRSCSAFNFNLPKPYFIVGPHGAELEGVPVRTREAVIAEHSGWGRVWDGVVSTVARSRIVRLMGQIVLQSRRRDCIEKVNPAIFQYMRERVKPGVRLIFAHLDGTLPAAVERQLQAMPEYISIAPMVQKLSASTGIPPERFKDRHPKAKLIQLYALALSEVLRR